MRRKPRASNNSNSTCASRGLSERLGRFFVECAP
jgi:hypothetical protein